MYSVFLLNCSHESALCGEALLGKINICHIISPLQLYGKEKWLLAFLKHLDSDRFTTSVITLTRDGSSALSGQLDKLGITTYPIGMAGKFSFRAIRDILGIIRSKGIEILHSHDYKADFMALIAGRKAEISILSTPHGWSRAKDPKLRFYQGLDQVMLRYFDMVVPLSPQLSTSLRFVKDQNNVLINNFVDLSTIPSRSEYESNTISFVGRLISIKRVEDIITAISLVKNKDMMLQIIGDGPLMTNLVNQAESLGISDRLQFLGFREDALELLSKSSILVLPSITEGTPRTGMEAMAMGIPVVGSDIPGIRTIVRHEETGILIPARDPGAIANQLDRLCGDPDLYRKISRNAARYIRENHSAQNAAVVYGELYEKLIASAK